MRITGNEINQRLMANVSRGDNDSIRSTESNTKKCPVGRVVLGILTLGVSEGIRFCVSKCTSKQQSNNGPRLGGGIGNPFRRDSEPDLYGHVDNDDIVNSTAERGRDNLGLTSGGGGGGPRLSAFKATTFK